MIKQYNTHTVQVGNVSIGGDNEIVLQSMTNTQTIDVEKTYEQVVRIYEAGGKIVRISTKNETDLKAFEEIKHLLHKNKINIPLVADIHFSKTLALKAAQIANKVRINPGNYFKNNELDEVKAISNIKANLSPLIEECKKHGCAIRIGTNQGSLSKRIINLYGNGAEGMVQQTMEFVRILKELNFQNAVLSVKASNIIENIKATRRLVEKLKQEGFSYPLHLGLTEAGFGFQGRIKSLIGIGVLLLDGIGDTIRVSLTESPENEIPFAKSILEIIKNIKIEPDNFTRYHKLYISHNYQPQKPVISIISKQQKYHHNTFNFFNDVSSFLKSIDNQSNLTHNCIHTTPSSLLNDFYKHSTNINNNIIICKIKTIDYEWEKILIVSLARLILDGHKLTIGLNIENSGIDTKSLLLHLEELFQVFDFEKFHCEFISCPSCNRTSFDIIKLSNEVFEVTRHLTHLKIAVMGCIVNGPGEMGEADYGILGEQQNKVALYYKSNIVKKNIPQDDAIDELISLIKTNGDWK